MWREWESGKKANTENRWVDYYLFMSWTSKWKNRFVCVEVADRYVRWMSLSQTTLWQTNCDSWLTVFLMQRMKYEYNWLEYVRNESERKVINLTFLTLRSNPSADTYRISNELGTISNRLHASQSNEGNKFKIEKENNYFVSFSVEMKNLLRFLPSTSVSSCLISSPINNPPWVRFPKKKFQRNQIVWQRKPTLDYISLIVPCVFDVNVPSMLSATLILITLHVMFT